MQFVIGWTMPDVQRDTQPVNLIAWHLGVGATLVAVMAIRVIWRLTHWPTPDDLPAATQRRLAHNAAQAADTLFVLLRPLAVAQDASPAILRPALRPTFDGMTVEIVKRRGPVGVGPLTIQLQQTPVLLSPRRRAASPFAPVAVPPVPVELVH
jgi:hypothetical protein